MGPTEHILKFLCGKMLFMILMMTLLSNMEEIFFLLQNFGETDSILELTAM